MPLIKETAKALCLVLSLSTILLQISHVLTFAHLEENIYNQYATVQGKALLYDAKLVFYYPMYNRILLPSIFVFTKSLMAGWTDVQVFLLLRLTSFVVCFAVIYYAVLHRITPEVGDPVTFCATLALSMIPTFFHGWVHSSDIIDLTLCFLSFLYIMESRFLPALLIACTTIVNREAGAFASVVYVCLAFGRERWFVVLPKSILIGAIPVLGGILVRKLVLGDELPFLSTGQSYAGLSLNLGLIIGSLTHPSPVDWLPRLMAMMLLPWLLFLNRASPGELKARVTLAFFAIFAVTAIAGISSEVRPFLPCVALLAAASVAIIKHAKS